MGYVTSPDSEQSTHQCCSGQRSVSTGLLGEHGRNQDHKCCCQGSWVFVFVLYTVNCKLDVPVVASAALCSPFRLIIFEVSGCVVHGLHETAVNSAPHQQGVPPSFSEEKKKKTRPLRLPREFVGSNSKVVWLLGRAWRSALRRILLWMTDHVNALRLG